MKYLVDANILLDVLQKREPHYKFSSIIWKLCEAGKAEGYVSVLTFMNLTYVLRKELTPERITEIYKALSLIFSFEDLTENDVRNAVEMGLGDFEDAVQIQTAHRVGAECIVTRNVKDYIKSPVPAFTPEELIRQRF